jgi:hypothetical protein
MNTKELVKTKEKAHDELEGNIRNKICLYCVNI